MLSLEDIIALRHSQSTNPRRTPSAQAVAALIDRIRTRFTRRQEWAQLTHGEQLVYTLGWTLTAEVDNGGFHQYLTNTSGETAETVRGYLREIGAPRTAALFDAVAAEWFQGGAFPGTRDQMGAVLWPDDDAARERLFERMSELEDAYRDGWPEMQERIMDYVESHRDDFAQPTKVV